MDLLFGALLLLAFILAAVFGLVSVLNELVERSGQTEPVFHEQGLLFSDQGSEQAPDRNLRGNPAPIPGNRISSTATFAALR